MLSYVGFNGLLFMVVLREGVEIRSGKYVRTSMTLQIIFSFDLSLVFVLEIATVYETSLSKTIESKMCPMHQGIDNCDDNKNNRCKPTKR